jgi:hypothetical protein
MEAAGVSWRSCCLPSVQDQGRVLKEPVSRGSFLQPLRSSASLPQQGHPVTLIKNADVIPTSQLPHIWTGKKSSLCTFAIVTIFTHKQSTNSRMKGENLINQPQPHFPIDEVIPESDDEAVYESVEIDVQGQHLTPKGSTVEGSLLHEPSRRSPLEKQVLAKSLFFAYG